MQSADELQDVVQSQIVRLGTELAEAFRRPICSLNTLIVRFQSLLDSPDCDHLHSFNHSELAQVYLFPTLSTRHERECQHGLPRRPPIPPQLLPPKPIPITLQDQTNYLSPSSDYRRHRCATTERVPAIMDKRSWYQDCALLVCFRIRANESRHG